MGLSWSSHFEVLSNKQINFVKILSPGFLIFLMDLKAHKCGSHVFHLKPLRLLHQVLFTIPIFVSYTALEKAGGLEVPVVWWHLMPFATTTQHAPPVGFGDGHTYFSFAAKLKWSIAYKTVYELVYKDAVRVHAYTRIIGMHVGGYLQIGMSDNISHIKPPPLYMFSNFFDKCHSILQHPGGSKARGLGHESGRREPLRH